MLEECLRALGRDFAAYRASWFSATYLALAPTAEEAAGLQSLLRRLLSAGVPATVGFALKQLLRVHKAGLLEVDDTLQALAPATLARAKGTALDALRLARSAESAHRRAVVPVATTALGNPNPEVQRAAADLLKKHGEGPAVAAAGDALAPSVQHELGLTVTRETGDESRLAQPLASPPAAVTSGELAERTAALLEDASDALEFEAVLAALATPGIGDELVALRRRARQVVDRGAQSDLRDGQVTELIALLVLSRLGERAPTGEKPATPALRFLVRRVNELDQSSAPLLATPDMPGGWVSPAALVERLQANREPRHHDLIAALLRLHPDGREGCATAAVPPAVRFALDRSEPHQSVVGGERPGPAAWWLAAERSWAPYGDGAAPRLHGEVRTHRWREGGKERTSRYTRFSVHSTGPGSAIDDQPTELPAGNTEHQWGIAEFGDWVATLAAIWPHDAEHFLAVAGLSTFESGSWTEVVHDVPRTLDALARHPGRMGSLAVHAIAAGISAGNRNHRFHAVDAFLDLVPTGRIAIADLVEVLVRYAEAWPAIRWAESLTAVSQAPGGGEVVVDLLTALLPQLPSSHRGLNKLLDLLRDLCLRQHRTMTDPTLTQWLGQFTGTSAAARTAQALLR